MIWLSSGESWEPNRVIPSPRINMCVTFSVSFLFLCSSTLVPVNDVRDAVGVFGESRKHLNVLLGQMQDFLECCGRWRVWLSPL